MRSKEPLTTLHRPQAPGHHIGDPTTGPERPASRQLSFWPGALAPDQQLGEGGTNPRLISIIGSLMTCLDVLWGKVLICKKIHDNANPQSGWCVTLGFRWAMVYGNDFELPKNESSMPTYGDPHRVRVKDKPPSLMQEEATLLDGQLGVVPSTRVRSTTTHLWRTGTGKSFRTSSLQGYPWDNFKRWQLLNSQCT